MEASLSTEGAFYFPFTFWQRADIMLFTFIMWLCFITLPNNMNQLNGRVSGEHRRWCIYTGLIAIAPPAYKTNSAVCEGFSLIDKIFCPKDTSNRTAVYLFIKKEVKNIKEKGYMDVILNAREEFVGGINSTRKGPKLLNMVFDIFYRYRSKAVLKWCFQVNCKSRVQCSAETGWCISKDKWVKLMRVIQVASDLHFIHALLGL